MIKKVYWSTISLIQGGAISRFDRRAIEIRLIDLQEAPVADLAIARFFIEVIKKLVSEDWSSLENQKKVHEDILLPTLLSGIREGDKMVIENRALLKCFGINKSSLPIEDFWRHILQELNLDKEIVLVIEHIINHGNLSTRILKNIGNNAEKKEVIEVYRKLSQCLVANELFI